MTIINILRDYERSGNSNPGYLIKLLQEFLDNVESFITVNELKHKISNWDHENPGKIDLNMIYHDLDNFYESNNYRIPYGDLEELFVKLFKNDIYEEIAVNFSLYFRTQDFTYSPITDSLNLVVDRDKDSFTEEQYDAVANFCNRNNVDLYVSNPCFEFWLYLHFIEVEQENKEMLLKNPRVSGSVICPSDTIKYFVLYKFISDNLSCANGSLILITAIYIGYCTKSTFHIRFINFSIKSSNVFKFFQ